MNPQAPEGWTLNTNGEFERRWTFPDFDQAFAASCRIALLASAQDHHPSLHVSWGSLVCTMISHDVNALTARDTKLALSINKALDH